MRAHNLKDPNLATEKLLPQENNLSGLPDEAVSQRFEDLSWADYAIFWPGSWERAAADLLDPDFQSIGRWRKGALDPGTGAVYSEAGAGSAGAPLRSRFVFGWYFDSGHGTAGHNRLWTDPGTNVPYACPACRTSYSGRRDRKYPAFLRCGTSVRALRKTTQLLATELFDAQRVSNPAHSAKLVSFSDSRQDAARAPSASSAIITRTSGARYSSPPYAISRESGSPT